MQSKRRIGTDFYASSSPTLTMFVDKLNELLIANHLEIVNRPSCLTNLDKLKSAQEEIRSQKLKMSDVGFSCATTNGLVHFLSIENSEELKILGQNEVREYYAQYAELTIKSKQCTCDGLCAVALKLAKNIIDKQALSHFTVEICQLRNWSHTLMRIAKIQTNKTVESVFYDPWYQMCHTTDFLKPKIFTEEALYLEMNQLIKQTEMIKATDTLLNFETLEEVENTSRDFSYFVLCSSGHFTNPAETRSDRSVVRSQTFCLVS